MQHTPSAPAPDAPTVNRRRALVGLASLAALAVPALSLRRRGNGSVSSGSVSSGTELSDAWQPLELSTERWKEILEPAAA